MFLQQQLSALQQKATTTSESVKHKFASLSRHSWHHPRPPTNLGRATFTTEILYHFPWQQLSYDLGCAGVGCTGCAGVDCTCTYQIPSSLPRETCRTEGFSAMTYACLALRDART